MEQVKTTNLYLYFGIAATIIFLLVVFFTIYFTRKYRAKPNDKEPDQKQIGHKFEIFILAVATAVTVFFLILTIGSMQEIQDNPSHPEPDISITGHQWWWEAQYPETGVVTANEIHIPAGKKILIAVTSADVIHSWWVPELGRKMDMIPGLTNYMWLYAEKPGEYLGACSEFCGVEHARMRLRVIADNAADYKKWSDEQIAPVVDSGTELFMKGQAMFEQKTCTNCHAINGTPYDKNIGPNLTHFASRKRFLSDMKVNNQQNLRAWLKNPQDVKAGVKMPNFIFSDSELNALVEYVNNLK